MSDGTYNIMIVDPDAHSLSTTVEMLRAAGHRATTASTFEEAKQLLDANAPDLLITEIRLGAFNGLHLAVRRQVSQPDSLSIVASTHFDRMLESEARSLSVPYVLKPLESCELLSLIDKMLRRGEPSAPILRKSPRRKIRGGFGATVDQTPALVCNVSDQGVGLEIVEAPPGIALGTFELGIPGFGLSVPMDAVWTRRDEQTGSLRCGALLKSDDAGVQQDWRGLVDALS